MAKATPAKVAELVQEVRAVEPGDKAGGACAHRTPRGAQDKNADLARAGDKRLPRTPAYHTAGKGLRTGEKAGRSVKRLLTKKVGARRAALAKARHSRK